MELPVDNRNRAIAYTLIILFLIIVLCLVLYFKTYNLGIVYTGLTLLGFNIAIGFYSVRKHDIKKAELSYDVIEVYHRSGLIKIPIKEIIEIYSGLNYFIDIKGRLSNTYVLYFNAKYAFGNRLFLKYYIKNNKAKGEPNEIQIIRENMCNSPLNHQTKL